jgi:exopolyphosphatase / guanosine-5'-triphosphate,3'-diphosphate pyrophosphatase
MNKIKLFIIPFLFAAALQAETVTRGAFDFGSGSIKLQVAEVDVDNHSVVRTIYDEEVYVFLSEDASRHPEEGFCEEIQKKAIEITGSLKEKALSMGATQLSGFATAAYRSAVNGQKLADRYFSELGIPVQIVSQDEEGKLGFYSLVAETHHNAADLVVWDIGGGSFQVTYLDDQNKPKVYMAPLGRSTTKTSIIEAVKKKNPSQTVSPNPMNKKEWKQSLRHFVAVLPKVPVDLYKKLQQNNVQVMGISGHPKQLRTLKTYHIKDIGPLLKDRLDKTDEELAKIHGSPDSAVSELALIYSVMRKLSIPSVTYRDTISGSTSGMLIDEKYWDKAAVVSIPAAS